MKISVTKADIAEGIVSVDVACPVALALHRQGFPGAKVGHDFLWNVAKTEIPIPMKALHFIRKFDNTGKGKPFTFTIPDK